MYINNGTEKTLQKNILKDKWIFENKEDVNARRFGDYFDVSHVVATLNNSVFVLNNYIEDDILDASEVFGLPSGRFLIVEG